MCRIYSHTLSPLIIVPVSESSAVLQYDRQMEDREASGTCCQRTDSHITDESAASKRCNLSTERWHRRARSQTRTTGWLSREGRWHHPASPASSHTPPSKVSHCSSWENSHTVSKAMAARKVKGERREKEFWTSKLQNAGNFTKPVSKSKQGLTPSNAVLKVGEDPFFFFLRCWRIYTRCTSLKMIILIKAYFWDLLSNFILPFWKTMLECELLYMDYSDKLTTMM